MSMKPKLPVMALNADTFSSISDFQTEYEKLCNGLSLRLKFINDKYTSVEEEIINDANLKAQKTLQLWEADKDEADSKFQELDESINKIKKLIEHTTSKLEKKEESLSRLDEMISEVTASNEQSKSLIAVLSKEVEEMHKVSENMKETSEDKLSSLEKSVQYFKDVLGLTFKRTNDDFLLFNFTKIDAQNESKQFSFCLKVLEDKKYEVKNCKPMVTNLDTYLAKLNETNNLSGFIKTMRKKFKDLSN